MQGALGLGEDEIIAYEPEPTNLHGDALLCAAGHFHSLFIRNGGEVWACGRNKENQVAAEAQALVFESRRIKLPTAARQIAASGVCHRHPDWYPGRRWYPVGGDVGTR